MLSIIESLINNSNIVKKLNNEIEMLRKENSFVLEKLGNCCNELENYQSKYNNLKQEYIECFEEFEKSRKENENLYNEIEELKQDNENLHDIEKDMGYAVEKYTTDVVNAIVHYLSRLDETDFPIPEFCPEDYL